MAYRKLLLIAAGIISIISFSCKDNPTDIGIGLLKNNLVNVKVLNSATDSLKQTSSSYKNIVPLGNGTKLMIGNFNNATGSVLLKFYFVNIPDSVLLDFQNKDATITSSYVSMIPYITFGDSLSNLDFTVHQINSGWGLTTFDADSMQTLSYGSADVSSDRKIADSLTTFTLDNNLVSDWLNAYIDSNYSAIGGIYLKPTPDSKKIIAYWAYNPLTSLYSQLNVVFTKQGAYQDTIGFLPIADISVIQATKPQVQSSDMTVQGGVMYNSKLSFDISQIPANSNIIQAILTLNLDSTESHYTTDIYNGVTLWNMSDSASAAIDSSATVTLSLSGNILQGDVTKLVQNWVTARKNQGLLIQAYNKNENVDLYVIKGSKDPDYNARPKLKITYTSRN